MSNAPTAPFTPEFVAQIKDPALNELSGVAVGHRNQRVFWVHNDSGDGPRLYALDSEGRTVATVRLDDADAVDWEDLAVGKGVDGRSTIFVADTGDNMRIRPRVTVYRTLEPLLQPGTGAELTVPAERLELKYPDGSHDCEALMRDPLSNQLYLVTKEEDGTARVYRTDATAPDRTEAVLQLALKINVNWTRGKPELETVTAGDISHDGTRIVLRTYEAIAEWERSREETVEKALAKPPARVIAFEQSGGEAISYGADAALYMVHEHLPSHIQRVAPMALGPQ